MAETELKRYSIQPDGWDDFLRILKRIAMVRERHGFNVLFALADRELNILTWAIRHEGDFDAAAERYYRDPERVELEVVGDYITEFQIRKVEEVHLT